MKRGGMRWKSETRTEKISWLTHLLNELIPPSFPLVPLLGFHIFLPPDCTFSEFAVCFPSPPLPNTESSRNSDLSIPVFSVHTVLTPLVILFRLIAWNNLYMQTAPKFLSPFISPNSRLPPRHVHVDVYWYPSLSLSQNDLHPAYKTCANTAFSISVKTNPPFLAFRPKTLGSS